MIFNLKQLFISLACFAIGVAVLLTYRRYKAQPEVVVPYASSVRSVDVDDEQFVDVTIPNASFSPREVVVLQIKALRAAQSDPQAMVDCYSLAAPSNRLQTGPFTRFASMVSMQPYNLLAVSDQQQVGEELIEGNFAAVLVTCLDQENVPFAFRFVLEKQQQSPYEDCWMTSGVQVEPLLLPQSSGDDLTTGDPLEH